MGRPRRARRARGRETKPGPAASGVGSVGSGFNSFRRMDTFLLAWGFLGLCLPGSGGTAETGKVPSGTGMSPAADGLGSSPARPTLGCPGARTGALPGVGHCTENR